MQLICEGNHRIDASEHVQLVQNKPVLHEEPVLVGSTPADGSGCSIYGTVIKDGGIYRMWYQAWPREWDMRDSHVVACAESDDGISWRRPAYGLVECGGTKANHLTDLPFHCPSVFIDPHADAASRYRAAGFARSETLGYHMAHSADGLHWVMEPGVLWPQSDVISSVWDPAHDCALIAMKAGTRRGANRRRTFYLSEWRDGQLTPPAATWCVDEYDDLQAQMRGFMSADYYGLGLMPTVTGTAFGFLWNFRHMLPISGPGGTGRVDLSLVYRTERWGRWQHVTGRPDWFSAEDAPPWARGALYTASTPVHVGDKTRLYITGTIDRHGACGLRPYEQVMRESQASGGFTRIGLLSWRRDRLLGYSALWDGIVTLVLPPGADRADTLELNLQTRPGGSVRVRLLSAQVWDEPRPIEGFGFDECEPIAGDHQRTRVRWKDKTRLPDVAGGESLRAEVKLDRATLWAYDFLGDAARELRSS